MKNLKYHFNGKMYLGIVTILIVFLTLKARGQSKDTIRVLFVGNSYTYLWNLPQSVNAMAATQNQVVITRQSTTGGAYLREHWHGKKGSKVLRTREKIKDGNWDMVVLQNNSMSTIRSSEDFMKYGKKFIRLVKNRGAKPLLYMTWARKYNPLMQKTVTKFYKKLASETNTSFVPVGPIWERARQLRPDLPLYFPDGSHPSPVGTYLIACVFYHAITGKNTETIPSMITTVDRNGEKLHLLIVTKENANFIHDLVDNYFSQESLN